MHSEPFPLRRWPMCSQSTSVYIYSTFVILLAYMLNSLSKQIKKTHVFEICVNWMTVERRVLQAGWQRVMRRTSEQVVMVSTSLIRSVVAYARYAQWTTCRPTTELRVTTPLSCERYNNVEACLLSCELRQTLWASHQFNMFATAFDEAVLQFRQRSTPLTQMFKLGAWVGLWQVTLKVSHCMTKLFFKTSDIERFSNFF